MTATPALIVHTSMVETVLCDTCLHVSRIRARLVHITEEGVRSVGQLDRCACCNEPPTGDPDPPSPGPGASVG